MTATKLRLALAAYAVLAVAALPLTDRSIRLALWVFLAGLAVKSVIAYYRARQGEAEAGAGRDTHADIG